jgi:hypothetical protein
MAGGMPVPDGALDSSQHGEATSPDWAPRARVRTDSRSGSRRRQDADRSNEFRKRAIKRKNVRAEVKEALLRGMYDAASVGNTIGPRNAPNPATPALPTPEARGWGVPTCPRAPTAPRISVPVPPGFPVRIHKVPGSNPEPTPALFCTPNRSWWRKTPGPPQERPVGNELRGAFNNKELRHMFFGPFYLYRYATQGAASEAPRGPLIVPQMVLKYSHRAATFRDFRGEAGGSPSLARALRSSMRCRLGMGRCPYVACGCCRLRAAGIARHWQVEHARGPTRSPALAVAQFTA